MASKLALEVPYPFDRNPEDFHDEITKQETHNKAQSYQYQCFMEAKCYGANRTPDDL